MLLSNRHEREKIGRGSITRVRKKERPEGLCNRTRGPRPANIWKDRGAPPPDKSRRTAAPPVTCNAPLSLPSLPSGGQAPLPTHLSLSRRCGCGGSPADDKSKGREGREKPVSRGSAPECIVTGGHASRRTGNSVGVRLMRQLRGDVSRSHPLRADATRGRTGGGELGTFLPVSPLLTCGSTLRWHRGDG